MDSNAPLRLNSLSKCLQVVEREAGLCASKATAAATVVTLLDGYVDKLDRYPGHEAHWCVICALSVAMRLQGSVPGGECES